MQNRTKEGKNNAVNAAAAPIKLKVGANFVKRILLMLFIAFFILGGVITIKTLIGNNRADEAYTELRSRVNRHEYTQSLTNENMTPSKDDTKAAVPSADFAMLREINADIIAWISCEGTAIDYPVLQTDNNEYYLDHLYNLEKNRIGSLFADFRNEEPFSDKNTVIYGHNMKNGSMFNSISEYKDQGYYDAFPTMRMSTPDGDYIVELFSGTVEDGNYEFVRFNFQTDEEFMEYVNDIRSRSTFQSDVVVDPSDRIVSLCTCSYEYNNARYMLVGKLTKADR